MIKSTPQESSKFRNNVCDCFNRDCPQPENDRLGNILDKMLEGAIDKRYQSAREILQDLQTQPVKVKHTGRKIAGVGAAVILGLLGLTRVRFNQLKCLPYIILWFDRRKYLIKSRRLEYQWIPLVY